MLITRISLSLIPGSHINILPCRISSASYTSTKASLRLSISIFSASMFLIILFSRQVRKCGTKDSLRIFRKPFVRTNSYSSGPFLRWERWRLQPTSGRRIVFIAPVSITWNILYLSCRQRTGWSLLVLQFQADHHYSIHFDKATHRPFHDLKLKGCNEDISQSFESKQSNSLLRFQKGNAFNTLIG